MGKTIKKVVILDAGGVLHPDAELAAPNQTLLAQITHLTEDEISAAYDHGAAMRGESSLREAFENLSQLARVEKKPTSNELLQVYTKGITLYPGAPEMIRELYEAGYQVVVLTTNSDLGILNTRELLAAENLSCVKVYGSAETRLIKPDTKAFLQVCEEQKVKPEECWFIDDREENLEAARSLGMSVIPFDHPAHLNDAAKAVNACRDELRALGVLGENHFEFPPGFNRGKYPSLLGLYNKKVVRYQAVDNDDIEMEKDNDNKQRKRKRSPYEVDEPNEDGNQRKRCLYQSLLSKLIVEQGRQYWEPAYHAINQWFLADFDLKSDPQRAQDYSAYFEKIGAVLKKEGLIEARPAYGIEDLRNALTKLFVHHFNLPHVSQFYYHVWLSNYGPEALESFVFLTDLLRKGDAPSDTTRQKTPSTNLLRLFPNMAQNREHDRYGAYFVAQPWSICGAPQLNCRHVRANAPRPAESKTLGIIRDDDPAAADFSASPHFAAKVFFSPSREQPFAKALEAQAAPVIAGPSGTLGRNIFMLSPLLQTGLLSQTELMTYVMGFVADAIYRGHHSYEEMALTANRLLFTMNPGFDPLRDPIPFYEQLLTDEFLASSLYREFSAEHADFFDRPAAIRQKF